MMLILFICSVYGQLMAAVQLPLLGRTEPDIDDRMGRLERVELDDDSWIDHCPGWLSGHATLMDRLMQTTRWHETTQNLYYGVVDTPRLTAQGDDLVPYPALRRIRDALRERYGLRFGAPSAALYRDGQDSVAWHRDQGYRDRAADGCVAAISLGSPRTFLVRPQGGGRSIRFRLGWGDLVILGGRCNRRFEHSVPKTADPVGPRIALMFRHGF
jgi:alkylated DNA repair dioxygenase AlkB